VTSKQVSPPPKRDVEDLAIFGGQPLFDETLHVGRPNQGPRREIMSRIEDILDRNWLTNNGPLVREFEQEIQSYLDVRHCVVVCNGTTALGLAAQALDLSGEIILPAFTFVATAHAFQWQGIRPVFVDIDPETHCIDPEAVRSAITPQTSAIVGVHTWGHPCEVGSLQELAREQGLALIFDAAHAFGVTIGSRHIGNFGDCEVLSFHATKVVNSFEGGAIVTNRDDIAERIRLTRNFGFRGMDRVEHLGINGKMPEVCAAMGLTSLEHCDELIVRNRERFLLYRSVLSGIPGLRVLEPWSGGKWNYHYVVAVLDPNFGLSRDRLMAILHAEGVRARRYFWPGCHRMEPYRSDPLYQGLSLEVTDTIAERVLQFPSGGELNEADIVTIGAAVRFVQDRALTISRMLHDRLPRS